MIYRHALLPGSYDPVTLGHLSLIKRASLFCEKVSACVFVNPAKSCLFSIEERKSFLALACESIPNASAHFHLGMEPEFAEMHGCDIIIKGVRDEKDLAYEKKIVTDWAKENGVDYLLMVGDTDENGVLTVKERYEIKGTANEAFTMAQGVPPMLLLVAQKGLTDVSSTAVRKALAQGENLCELLVPQTVSLIKEAYANK